MTEVEQSAISTLLFWMGLGT